MSEKKVAHSYPAIGSIPFAILAAIVLASAPLSQWMLGIPDFENNSKRLKVPHRLNPIWNIFRVLFAIILDMFNPDAILA
jgi:hypothetical protein